MNTDDGYCVDTTMMRRSASGFVTCASDVETSGSVLKAALGNESYLGNDEAAQEFRKKYEPLRDGTLNEVASVVSALEGVKKGVDGMADSYDGAESASTVTT